MDKRRRIAIEIVIGSLLIAALYFLPHREKKTIWPANRIDIDGGHRTVMGTIAHTIAVAMDLETARKSIEAAFEQLVNVENLMSRHRNDSEVSKINREAYKNPVRVSKSTFEVLQRAVKFGMLSDGAFDVTVGPLVDLWNAARDVNIIPSEKELDETRSNVGYDKLILDANEMSVRFAVEGMKLDVGGIAKGYGIDAAVEAMKKCGAIGGMVDAGGDIRCFGAPPSGKEFWLIGLQDSRKTMNGVVDDSKLLMILKIVDGAIATSGDYRRFAVIEGKVFSHIINPETGYSGDKFSSVTIIAPNATDADALATAVSVMGKEKGLKMIESLDNTEAILVSPVPDYDTTSTKGAGRYIQ